jgi:hypothetical protein
MTAEKATTKPAKTKNGKVKGGSEKKGGDQTATAAKAVKIEEVDFEITTTCIVERYPILGKEVPDWFVAAELFKRRVTLGEKRRAVDNWELMTTMAPALEGKLGLESREHFTPASRTTKADETNDRRSVARRLDERLFLILQTLDGKWHLPRFLYPPTSGNSLATVSRLASLLLPLFLSKWLPVAALVLSFLRALTHIFDHRRYNNISLRLGLVSKPTS